MGLRIPLLFVAVLAVIGFSAGPALAAGTSSGDVSSFSFQPSGTAAGSSQDLNLNVAFSASPETMQLNMAPGLWASLSTGYPGTQIGTGKASLTAAGLLPQTANLTLTTTAPAAAGGLQPCSSSNPPGPCVLLGLSLVAVDSTFGLSVTAPGYAVLNPNGTATNLSIRFPSIPNSADGIPIAITNLQLTLAKSTTVGCGSSAPSKCGPFVRLPSYTTPAKSTASVSDWSNGTGSASDTFTPTGTPDYKPAFGTTTATANSAANPDGSYSAKVEIDVTEPDYSQGVNEAGTSGMQLVIPTSALWVSGQAIKDLCGAYDPSPPATCDPARNITNPIQVGTVSLGTPLLPTGDPHSTGEFLLSGSIDNPIATIKFPGLGGLSFSGSIPDATIGANPEVNFNNIPDVPFSSLDVTLGTTDANGNPGMLNAACGNISSTLNATFYSWWAPTTQDGVSPTMTGNGAPCTPGGDGGYDSGPTGINTPDPGPGPTYTPPASTSTDTTDNSAPSTDTSSGSPSSVSGSPSSGSQPTGSSAPSSGTPSSSGSGGSGSAGGTSTTTPKPTPATPAAKPKVGKPTLTNIVLTGVRTRKPKLAFTVNQGKNAAKISSFTVEPPGAFSFNKNALKKDLKITGAKLKSYKLSGRKLTIYLKTAASHPRVTLNAGALSEWKQLQTAVKKHKAKSLNMNVWASAGKTSTPFRSTIKKFS
ncbi:MAG: hypothetical protein J2O48_07195 [Solirubrobacterales bacterium]|nr:hypothetical protein [Solirubrobacterales bacterium]